MDAIPEKDYDIRKVNPIPIKFDGDDVYMVCLVENLINSNEASSLSDYVEKILNKIDDKRRKKYLRIKNKKMVKNICRRWRIPEYYLDGIHYKFKSYSPIIEVIQWQKDKSLCDINFDSVTGGKYKRNDMINYLLSLDGSKTTLLCVNNQEKEVSLMGNRSLVWNSAHASLQETRSSNVVTQIYLHVLYEP